MAEILEFKDREKEKVKDEINALNEELNEKWAEYEALLNRMDIYVNNVGAEKIHDNDMDKIFDMLHEIKILQNEVDDKERSIGMTPLKDRPEVQQMWKDAWDDARKEFTGFSVVK